MVLYDMYIYIYKYDLMATWGQEACVSSIQLQYVNDVDERLQQAAGILRIYWLHQREKKVAFEW